MSAEMAGCMCACLRNNPKAFDSFDMMFWQ